MWRRLRRGLLSGLGLSLPGLVVLGGLAAAGLLGQLPALAAGAALFVLMTALFGPWAAAVGETRGAMDRLAVAPDLDATHPRSPATGALYRSLNRLARAWRARLNAAEAQRAAAEAVLGAVPDPLILIDDKRQIVRANAPSSEFIGSFAEPRDLAAALRNPELLAAADAVLAGEAACIVEFGIAIPVERRLRARISRIGGPAPGGAVAILTLHDITALTRAEQMRADFIANASHELKTPLTTLLGFIETLEGPARGDAKARDRFLAIMHQQALRMTRLVDDLLSLSRIELN
jgi:two-component system phosphate regulon sensor histidine kinase PhoR